ncbi:MAG: ribosome biogenesis factor YjgA [Rhodocyclaceae bacterium]
MIHDTDPHDGEAEEYRGPSKSSLKREMHALQALGEALVALSPERLNKVPMPDNLRAAVREAQRITKHGAVRRQLQYIGKLMRHVDPAPIQAKLDAFNGVSRAAVARHHRLERLRDDFLVDEQVLGRIAEEWPQADLQHLRVLRRNAIREREQEKPPRAYRELFRILRELDEQATEAREPEPVLSENAQSGHDFLQDDLMEPPTHD